MYNLLIKIFEIYIIFLLNIVNNIYKKIHQRIACTKKIKNKNMLCKVVYPCLRIQAEEKSEVIFEPPQKGFQITSLVL